MAIPTGAQNVKYDIAIGTNPEAQVTFTAAFNGGSDQQAAYDAIEAGADAMVAYLEAEFPSHSISVASRSHDASIQGDVWPTP